MNTHNMPGFIRRFMARRRRNYLPEPTPAILPRDWRYTVTHWTASAGREARRG